MGFNTYNYICQNGREIRNQIANICWIIEKGRELQKNIYFCFIDYAKAFDCVQFSSVAQSCLTLCNPKNRSMPGLPVHHQLLELTQTHVHWVSDAIQPSHPLFSPSSPAFNLLQHQGLFQWVSSLHQVAKVLELQLQHQCFQWTPGLIYFRMDWLDLLAVQGTLESLLQHHSSKASILQHSAFFIVHSHSHIWLLEKS